MSTSSSPFASSYKQRCRRALLCLATVFILGTGATGCYSDTFATYGEYDNSEDGKALDFSPVRPDYGPKDSELTATPTAPQLNQERASKYVIGGDERKFILVRSKGEGNKFVRQLQVKEGDEYEAYIFFRNNSPAGDNSAYDLTARDVRVALIFSSSGRWTSVGAVVGGTNTSPSFVASSAVLYTAPDKPFIGLTIESARLYKHDGTVIKNLSTDELQRRPGVPVEDGGATGVLKPGSFGFIVATLKARASEYNAKYEISWTATTRWQNYAILPGNARIASLRLTFTNTGDSPISNVVLSLSSPFNDSPMGTVRQAPDFSGAPTSTGISYAVSGSPPSAIARFTSVHPNTSVVKDRDVNLPSNWIRQICEHGSITFSATIQADAFNSANYNVLAYPKEGVCQ